MRPTPRAARLVPWALLCLFLLGAGAAVAAPPTAGDDGGSVSEGGTTVVTVLANDSDGDDNLDPSSVDAGPASHGTVSVNGDGTVEYTHDGGESTSDSFTYTVQDSLDEPSNTATVTITVSPINDPPTANANVATGGEGAVITINVAGNDTDPDDGLDLTSVEILSDVDHGTTIVNANGTVDYDHDGGETTSDSFTYRISDQAGAPSNIATVSITVTPVNDAPTAVANTATVNEGSGVTINVAANDTDPDNALDLGSIEIVGGADHGTTTVNGDGTVDYDHDGSETVNDSFSYRISDEAGAPSNTVTVSITVTPVNDDPTAFADGATVAEGGGVNVSVAANDQDPEGLDLSSIEIMSPPDNGTATPQPNGTVDYDHDGSETTSDSFSYRISDEDGAPSNTVTVSITVTPGNDPPAATPDAYPATEDTPLNVSAPGVLDNDSDPEGSALTAILVTDVAHGTLSLAANGSFTYTSDADYNGPDAFTYRASDGTLESATTSVTLTVNPVNDAPAAAANAYSVAEDVALNVSAPGVLGNDGDPEGGALTAILVTDVAHGTLSLAANGSFTYTSDADYNGPDGFTYRASDGSLESSPATVSLTVDPVNDPPQAGNNSGSVSEGSSVNIDVAGNDADEETEIDLGSIEIVTPPAHGTADPQNDGSITYTHDGGESTSDTFTYRIYDDEGAPSNTALVTVTITGANDAPAAAADGGTVSEGASTTVNVAQNDVDPEGDLDVTSVAIVAGPAHGTATPNANGTVGYTHDGSETTSDSFTYTIDDGLGATSNTATVSITVTPVNDAPGALADAASVAEGGSVGIDVAQNDVDPEGSLDLTSITIVGAPAHGTATPHPDGTVTYAHNGGEAASDAFTYRIEDAQGAPSNVAQVTITITGDNDPPSAANDAATVAEAASTTVNVAANDQDPEGALDLASVTIATPPAHGTATPNPNGTVGYTHNGSETTSDSFTYTIEDGPGATSNTATVSITVTPVNDAPSAANDAATLAEGGSSNINVAQNDQDPENTLDPASIQVVSAASHGTTTPNANGTVTYTHDGGESTSDSFTYLIRDAAAAASDPAVVTITVTPVNDPPTAVDDSRNVGEGASVAVNVAGNDTDPENALDLTSIEIVTGPSHGLAFPQANGTVSYTHDGGESTSDSFTYRIQDQANATSNTATVSLTVSPGNDPPVALNDTGTAAEGASVNVNVSANDSDTDDGIDPASIQIVGTPAHGTATPNANGTVTYTHDGGETSSDGFTYTIEDQEGTASNAATVSITVTPVNDPPVAVAGSHNVAEDGVLNVAAPGVLGNDTDAENNSLTAVRDADVAHGTLSLQSNGAFTYTPNANYNGPDQFTYHAHDGAASSNIVAVNLTVTPVNDAPLAAADAYAVDEDGTLTVTAGIGVLVNDSDAESSPLTAVLDTGVSHGTLNLNSSGSFTYTPVANYNGIDQFTYHASDGTASSNVATVTLTVNSVNDAPVAASNSYNVTEDAALNVAAPGVLGNDSDVDLDLLTAEVGTLPGNGSLTLNPDGSFTYTPAAGYNGTDSFTYRATDGNADSAPATVTLNVGSVNDPPLAQPDAYPVNEDNTLTVGAGSGVLINDSDPDGAVTLTAAVATNPSHGTLALAANGSFTYTPAAHFNGTDTFTYRASDGTLQSDPATVTITVNSVNDAPVAVADAQSVNEDAVLTLPAPGVLANDTDVELATLSAVPGSTVTHGTLTLNADGSFTYTPTANYNGTDSFTYRASDGITNSAPATVTLTVNPVNDAPVAVADAYGVAEDNVLTVPAPGVLANDSDPDGATSLTAASVTGPSHGNVTLNADGSFTYTPVANYNGADSFTYRANDGAANSTPVTVTLTVTSGNDAPTATADGYVADEDTGLSVPAPGVLGNDTDLEGSPLTAVLDTGPAHGLLVLNANGSFSYTASSNYHGPDSFTYHASDGATNSTPATVNLTVNPVNDAPAASPDLGYATTEDTPLTVNAPGVLGNDSDVDGDSLTAVLAVAPTNGTASVAADGSFTYTPNANWNGTDVFRYQADDGTTTSPSVQVRVTVSAVNDPPTAVADAGYAVNEDGSLVVTVGQGVLMNDVDVELMSLTAILDTGPSHGVLALAGDGSFTYTPASNYSGPDGFTYHANDGEASSTPVAVSISVGSVNDPPVAVADLGYTVEEDSFVSIPAAQGVLLNDTDTEGDPLTAVLDAVALHGMVSLEADGSFEYVPDSDYAGQDQFTYHANDGAGSSTPVAVRITVTAINDPPVAVSDGYLLNEDAMLDVDAPGIVGNDVDADGNALTAVLDTGVSHGTLSLAADGSFTYMPEANYHGADAFTYHVTDGTESSSPVAVGFSVRAVNDPPVAMEDDIVVSEGASGGVTVLDNDTDADGDPLTVTAVTQGTYGSVSTNGTTVLYVHNGSQSTGDTFTYTVGDGTIEVVGTVNVAVAGINDPPVTAPDLSYVVSEDTTLVIAAPGVLGNDTDADGDTLRAVIGATATKGALTLGAGGGFTYVPNANVNGQDFFTYRANDGHVNSGLTTARITINAVNDAPVAVADAYTVKEDSSITVSAGIGVLVNDTDAEANALTAILDANVQHGTLSFSASGAFAYTPAANYNGTDSFTYHAMEALTSNVTTVTITVTPANDPPVAVDDPGFTTPEDQALVVAAPGVLGNDSDMDGGTLTAVVLTQPAHGAVVVNANGSFTYTPTANYSGPDAFTYRAVDAGGAGDVGDVTLTVTPVNDVPVAVNDPSYSTGEDSTLTVNAPGVLGNDTDADGNTLSAALVTPASAGSVVLNGNGSFVYTPPANFNGSVTFTYRAGDGTVTSDPATVTIAVTSGNDAPTATADGGYGVNEDVTLNVAAPGVLGNDTDPEGNPLTATLGSVASSGTVTLNPNGAFTYVPNANFNGTDTFTYRANDGTTNSPPATVTITVNPVNDAPVAAADPANGVDEDDVLVQPSPGVLGNDTDADGNPLTAELVVGPTHGVLALAPNGSFTYTPAANYNGPDGFTYRAKDASSASAPAAVTLTVRAQNDPPTATADGAYGLGEDSTLVVGAPGVLGNDLDMDGDNLSALVAALPAHGTLTLNLDGSFSFVPGANYNGNDQFSYYAVDGSDSSLSSVALTVRSVNDAPTVDGEAYTLEEDDTLTVAAAAGLLVGDTDMDGDPLTAALASPPNHGSATVAPNGSFTYIPQPDYSGPDNFSYQASDGTTTSTAVVSLSVTAVNDAPLAVDDLYNVMEDNTLHITAGQGILINDSDVEFNDLRASLLSGVAHGSLSMSLTGAFSYTPDPNFAGADSFSYRVSDQVGGISAAAIVHLQVESVNDAPIAIFDIYSIREDSTITLNAPGILQNDSDAEGDPLQAVLISSPAQGVVSLSPTGAFTYTPNRNVFGADIFRYQATDGALNSSVVQVRFNIAAVNDAPTSLDDFYNVNTGGQLTVTSGSGVLINDYDPEFHQINAVKDTDPASGTLTLNTSGSFVYTPNTGFSGTDHFTYHAVDSPGGAASAIATVTLKVQAPGAPALVNPGTQFDKEGDAVTLQMNASDPDGDPLTYAAVNLPPGLSLNTSSGLISGSIDCGAAAGSPYQITVTTADGVDGDATARFSWEVQVLAAPAAINSLSALPVRTNPGTDGTVGVVVSWSASEVGANDDVTVYRKAFGNYPEYSDAGSVTPATPLDPAQAIAQGWTLTGVTAPGQVDDPGPRDVWFYVAFVHNPCSRSSNPSNRPAGCINYYLGDVAPVTGDNHVDIADVSVLGDHYGITIGPDDPWNLLDVGPTSTGSPSGIPTTDNRVQFEDLMIFALNFGVGTGAAPAPNRSSIGEADPAAITLRLPTVLPGVGETFEVAVELRTDGRLTGFTLPLTWDPTVVEPVRMTRGKLMEGAALALSPEPGTLDVVAVGSPLSEDGAIATWTFRVVGTGDPGLGAEHLAARDEGNRPLEVPVTLVRGEQALPALTRLLPAAPNPFLATTAVAFDMAQEGRVVLQVFGVDGRLVRTLLDATLPAGRHEEQWDARDATGREVASGTYFLRLVTRDGSRSQRVVRLR